MLILIPARYHSTRFPGKPLKKIMGRSMLDRVYTQVSSLAPTFVVTDHGEIENAVKDFGGKALRVDDEVSSGTDRIYLALSRFFPQLIEKDELIILLQGDEPLIRSEHIQSLAKEHQSGNWDMGTLVRARQFTKDQDLEDFQNPNMVKALWNPKNKLCPYFSRSPIPHLRKGPEFSSEGFVWYQHIGIYSYRAQVLQDLAQMPPSSWEKSEHLEQLRAIESGYSIGGALLGPEDILLGVDTPEDIGKIERYLKIKNHPSRQKGTDRKEL